MQNRSPTAEAQAPIRVGILTSSDACSRGERADASGDAIRDALTPEQYRVVHRDLVPDDADQIEQRLRAWLSDCDLILTTGGTGFSPRDVTPEATLRVVERLVPGIPEALRADGLAKTRMAMLSRGVAGIAGQTLIVNLPGSPRAVREGMTVLLPVLEHAIGILKGTAGHGP